MKKVNKKSLAYKLINSGTVSKKDIVLFTKNLAVLLKSGSTLSESLIVLYEQSKGKLKLIIDDVQGKVNSGQRFSVALSNYPKIFNNMYRNMLEMGETSGKLDSNLEHLAEQLEKNYELKKKILNSMLYPMIVFIGGIALASGIVFFILPKVSKLFKNFNAELPFSTRLLLNLSDFLQAHGLITVVIFVFSIIFLSVLLKKRFMNPITHWIILKTPVVRKISLNLNMTLMCRTLSVLLDGGLTIDESIAMAQKGMPNYYYRRFLARTLKSIKSGETFTSSLKEHKNLFSKTDIQIIHVGETTGSLTKSLKYCSGIHEKETDSLTKSLSTIIEPILLISIGLLIGFLALSIITPIYSITGQFRK